MPQHMSAALDRFARAPKLHGQVAPLLVSQSCRDCFERDRTSLVPGGWRGTVGQLPGHGLRGLVLDGGGSNSDLGLGDVANSDLQSGDGLRRPGVRSDHAGTAGDSCTWQEAQSPRWSDQARRRGPSSPANPGCSGNRPQVPGASGPSSRPSRAPVTNGDEHANSKTWLIPTPVSRLLNRFCAPLQKPAPIEPDSVAIKNSPGGIRGDNCYTVSLLQAALGRGPPGAAGPAEGIPPCAEPRKRPSCGR
jgi:hypothetical protein